MPVEIERKFLVTNTDWKNLDQIAKINITQGYLQKSQSLTVRVRVTDDKAFLTIKGPTTGISRAEYEYEIPLDEGHEMLKMCTTPQISKTRHLCRDEHNQVWEIDVFKGLNAGLIVAEIELDSEDRTVVIHDWVGTDVSHDKRYSNAYLVDHEVPKS